MKKNLRSRLLAVAAVAVSSVMLLSGFDSSMTAQDVMAKAQEANKGITQFSANAQANADVQLAVAVGEQTTTMPMTGTMNMDIKYVLDPLQMAMTGTASGDASAMGLAGEAGMEMYMVSEEDGGKVYIKLTGIQGADGWQAAAIPADQINEVKDLINKAMTGDYASISEETGIDVQALQDTLYEDLTLAPEAVTVNGKECYELTCTIDGNKVYEIVAQMAAANENLGIDESTLQMIQLFGSMLKINMVMDYDVETFHPVYAAFDMNGSDFSMIGAMIGSLMFSGQTEGEEAPAVELTVNTLNLAYSYDYETPVSIEVPAEALDAQMTDISQEAAAIMDEADVAA